MWRMLHSLTSQYLCAFHTTSQLVHCMILLLFVHSSFLKCFEASSFDKNDKFIILSTKSKIKEVKYHLQVQKMLSTFVLAYFILFSLAFLSIYDITWSIISTEKYRLGLCWLSKNVSHAAYNQFRNIFLNFKRYFVVS